MMMKALVLLLLFGYSLGVTQLAAAELDEFSGGWQQIKSDDGACPTCRVDIKRHGDTLFVTANNGWYAAIRGVTGINGPTTSGSGTWVPSGRSALAGHSFDATFALRASRLEMVMTVDMGRQSPFVIKAAFRRDWIGT